LHERLSSSLDDRIDSINMLLDKWFKVGLRFLPLLPVDNYIKVYWDFLDNILDRIDLSKIYSIQAWSLLYTKLDYNKIIKKEFKSDYLYRLNDFWEEFVRAPKKFRKDIYNLFSIKLWKFNICLDDYEI
jgi:hypothetical protein